MDGGYGQMDLQPIQVIIIYLGMEVSTTRGFKREVILNLRVMFLILLLVI